MHIDRTDQITVSREPASTACPGSAFGLVFVPTARTPAAGSSFGAGEARDAGLFCFVAQIANIFSIFPQSHPLIVVSTIVLIAYSVGVADEKRSDLIGDTEVNHLPSSLMTQVTNASLSALTHPVLRSLQLLPATRASLAAGLFLRNVSQLLLALTFERTDSTTGHNHGLGSRCGNRSQVNFTEVYCGLIVARSLFAW